MIEWLPILMVSSVFGLIFLGYPVAFSLGGASLVFMFIGVSIDAFDWPLMTNFSARVYNIEKNQILLAIPFFIFMGTMLQKSKLAEDLLTTIGALFGSMRGGVALAVVFVGALLAAATGVVGASVVAMGLISMPVMLRYNYSKELACGVICASGTLGQIIPPSVVLIVLADQLGVSASDLFQGAFLPGVMLAGLYALYVGCIAFLKPNAAPALPVEVRQTGGKLLEKVIWVLIPPLFLIVVVLGSILFGLATPTEAGALGAVGSMALAKANRRLDLSTLQESLDDAVKLTSMVLFLLIGSTAFVLVFKEIGGEDWIRQFLSTLPGGVIGFLLVANLTIFVLGFFIDFFEIAFILLPLLLPAAQLLGIDLIWFGVILGLNLQTSFLTPPFGFSLFYLRGVAPEEVKTSTIYRGVLPFIGIQVFAITVVCLFPELVTWLAYYGDPIVEGSSTSPR